MQQEQRDAILLIEDEPRLHDLVVEALAKSRIDAELVSTKDGLEAIDALYGRGIFAGKDNNYLPKLILMNLNLSHAKLTGIEVIHILRSELKTWDIPIVVVSGTDKQLQELKSDTLKPDAYVLAPGVQTVEQMVRVLEENWRQ